MVRIKKGISMIVLLITIAVFLILVTVVTISSNKILNNTKKKQFAREIYEVQNLVDKYKYEKEEYPYTILDDNTNESISIDITDEIKNQFENENITEDNKVVLYSIDLNKIGAENITRGIKKDNNLIDIYAFSNKTGIVYDTDGYKVGNNTYYTLTDELKKIIGYGKDNSNETDSKIISEIPSMDYVQDGLVLLLDGIENTRGGHSASTNVWEDLSGNNYDVTMENIQINNNNMYFSGDTSIMYSLNNINAVSVEMVLELEETEQIAQYIAYFGSTDKILAWSPTKNAISLGHNKKRYSIDELYKLSSISVQYNPDAMYLNSKKLELNVGSESWMYSSQYPFMISGYSGGWRMKGKIYSIRVYNRALTQEEINHNYMVDKARYGIK